MQHDSMKEFKDERDRLNNLVMDYAGTNLKRLWHLDGAVYREGALPVKTKELLGLVSSLILRCDDCINYHVIRCHEEGITSAEIEEALTIGLTVGGSITIPHLRRAFETWDQFQKSKSTDQEGS